jgi:penicillin amidase
MFRPDRELMRRILLSILVLGAVVLAAFLVLVASTFPPESGSVKVSGVSAPLAIETDPHGVPTIRAATETDALFGLGYVHARDRLWQMEYQRRIGAGRLAEVLGPGVVDTDRFLRTVGFRRAAESAWRSLSAPAQRKVEAYVRGVNSFLASSPARPVEFRILQFTPAPFDPVDALVWAKLMAWDLGGNARDEIRRTRFAAAVGPERAAELLPPVPATPTILEDGEWSVAPPPRSVSRFPFPVSRFPSSFWSRLDNAFARAGARDPDDPGLGSNSWVLAGSRTTTGKPILANDPHLGLRVPSVWYLARLSAPGYSVAGATLPGLPGVVIGRNGRIAWALTSLEPDVQDLFVEDVDPADETRYRWKGEWRRFDTRRETIRIRGRSDAVFPVRESVHGPIVSDVLEGASALGPAVAFRWTALDRVDRTAEAIDGIDRAENWTDFVSSVRLFHAPAQNFLYADVDGHIGYSASGAIPIRPRADGLRPASGSGEDDWSGYVPFEALPRAFDPPRGFVVAANNRVASERYPFAISGDWPEPYRARRITERILEKGKLGISDVRSIQVDRVSLQAEELLPVLLDTALLDVGSRDALARLRAWNREFAPGSAAAAIYAAWYAGLARMAQDEVGSTPLGGVRSRFLINALRSDSPWCDDVRTPARETCAGFRSTTLRDALSFLRGRLGSDPARWRWDRLHRARFPHGVFESVRGLRALFSLETGQGGDASTVNVGAYRLDGSFRMTDGPSYRQIVDLSGKSGDLLVHTTGQSGNVFDRRYRDFLPLWREGTYLPPREAPVKALRLLPR